MCDAWFGMNRVLMPLLSASLSDTKDVLEEGEEEEDAEMLALKPKASDFLPETSPDCPSF